MDRFAFPARAILVLSLLASSSAFAQPMKVKAQLDRIPDPFAEIVDVLHNKPVTFDKGLKGMSLGKMLEELEKQTDGKVRFVVREDLFRAAGPDFDNFLEKQFSLTSQFNEMSVHDFLRTALPDIKSGMLVFKNRIEITTWDMIAAQHGDLPDREDDPFDKYHEKLFNTPLVSESFRDKPLAEALEELSKHYDRTIVLMGQTTEQAKTPITARLMNVPLPLALTIIARNADLHVVESGQTFIVTTAVEMNAQRIKVTPKVVK